MPMITCPHCGAQNTESAAFCEACGKAVPAAAPSGPRVVDGKGIASTGVGKDLQAGLLRKQAGKAAGALFAVAILQTIGGIVFYFLLKGEASRDVLRTLLWVNLSLAAIYAALGFWARANPLPAAIVGLVLFVSVIVIGAVMDPKTIVHGIIVKIIVIVVLAKAIQAGTKYRELQQQIVREGGQGDV